MQGTSDFHGFSSIFMKINRLIDKKQVSAPKHKKIKKNIFLVGCIIPKGHFVPTILKGLSVARVKKNLQTFQK